MKTLSTKFNEKSFNSFETLSNSEMLKVRGGVTPEKPETRPKEDYDIIEIG